MFLKIFTCATSPEVGIVLSLFLIFDDFEPRCSYKIVLKKKSVYSDRRDRRFDGGLKLVNIFLNAVTSKVHWLMRLITDENLKV